jgi:hypothetical protein
MGVLIQATLVQNRRSGFELRRTLVLPTLSSNQREKHGNKVFGCYSFDANDVASWVQSTHASIREILTGIDGAATRWDRG